MPTIITTAPRRKPEEPQASTNRPENAATGIMPYSLFQCLLFLACAFFLIFALCAMGRPGA